MLTYYPIPRKNLIRGIGLAATLLAVIILFSLAGCKKDDPGPTKVQEVTALLTSAASGWQPASVTVDGVEVRDDLFSGFSITFSENTLTTTGTTPVWKRQDTWTFKDENANVIIRGSDGKEVAIKSISESELKLTLEWDETTTIEEGRQHALKGTHEFTLQK